MHYIPCKVKDIETALEIFKKNNVIVSFRKDNGHYLATIKRRVFLDRYDEIEEMVIQWSRVWVGPLADEGEDVVGTITGKLSDKSGLRGCAILETDGKIEIRKGVHKW